ncbi:MAG: hypothetical protein WCV55_01520 [Candidatus Paceibacterota bacterium]
MAHKIIKFFDKLEDRVRGYLSHFPIIYSLIGGIAVVLFWRGVWHTADIIMQYGFSSIIPIAKNILETKGFISFIFFEPVNLVLSTIVLLVIGLFVSFFIGDRIILSGIRNEKKLAEKTEEEIALEENILHRIENRVKKIEEKLNS